MVSARPAVSPTDSPGQEPGIGGIERVWADQRRETVTAAGNNKVRIWLPDMVKSIRDLNCSAHNSTAARGRVVFSIDTKVVPSTYATNHQTQVQTSKNERLLFLIKGRLDYPQAQRITCNFHDCVVGDVIQATVFATVVI